VRAMGHAGCSSTRFDAFSTPLATIFLAAPSPPPLPAHTHTPTPRPFPPPPPQAESTRQVSPEEGAAFARRHGCMYRETSAKTDSGGVHEGVYDALVWGMVCTILDTPGLVGVRGGGGGGAEVDLSGEGRRRRGGPLGACCN
jgi:hypothetical protein